MAAPVRLWRELGLKLVPPVVALSPFLPIVRYLETNPVGVGKERGVVVWSVFEIMLWKSSIHSGVAQSSGH